MIDVDWVFSDLIPMAVLAAVLIGTGIASIEFYHELQDERSAEKGYMEQVYGFSDADELIYMDCGTLIRIADDEMLASTNSYIPELAFRESVEKKCYNRGSKKHD